MIGEFDVRPSRTRCGLVTFSDVAWEQFSLLAFPTADDMQLAVARTPQLTGGTRTDLGLEHVRRMLQRDARQGAPRIVVVMTDGRSEFPSQTKHQAAVTKAEGIVILAVGIGNRVDRKELRHLASRQEYVFEVDTFQALHSIRDLLAIRTCHVQKEEDEMMMQGDQPLPAEELLTSKGK